MIARERLGHEKCEHDCRKVCCTKIEGFRVMAGRTAILDDISLHIHCGELTALIGSNGAGKSTLLKAILGEVRHDGVLTYFDAKGARTGHPLIGYVPQYLRFDVSTPTNVLDLFTACLSHIPAWLVHPKHIRDLAVQGLEKVKAVHLLERRLGALSGGELQRVLLALALEPVPDLLLLDEPVAGIDRNGLELFYTIVSELRENYDLSIILISHDFNLVEKYADRVILLNQGAVVANGTPREVFQDGRTREIFGMALPQG